jgi:hypothetical protein
MPVRGPLSDGSIMSGGCHRAVAQIIVIASKGGLRMRKMLAALVGATAILIPAQAQADANYGYCYAGLKAWELQVTPIFAFPALSKYQSVQGFFEDFIEREFGRSPSQFTCNGFDTEGEAANMRATHMSNASAQGTSMHTIAGFDEYLREMLDPGPSRKPKPSSTSTTAKADPKPEADELPRKSKADYDAEFAVKQAAYERELAEQQRKVEEFEQAKRDLAQRQSDQKAAAQQALNQHADAMRQHDAEIAKYQAEVQAAAAASIRADFDRRHNLGQASTDTDANRCVTTPETQQNVGTKGNTAASVINGCGQPVDVRICLMTADGWNCGVTYGLAGQAKWSWSSMNATGPVFMDARVTGSNRPFTNPQ